MAENDQDKSTHRLAGYAALLERYNLDVIPNWPRSFVATTGTHRIDSTGGVVEEVYTNKYWPGDTLGDHLEFALKYDGTNLGILTALFQAILPPASFRDMAYTGDRFTSAQAHEMGYVDELVPSEGLVARAVDLAGKLGQSNARTYGAIKREMRRHVLDIMRTQDPKAGEALVKSFEASSS